MMAVSIHKFCAKLCVLIYIFSFIFFFPMLYQMFIIYGFSFYNAFHHFLFLVFILCPGVVSLLIWTCAPSPTMLILHLICRRIQLEG